MRHPLWIVSSSLFLLCCLAALFIIFSRQEVPERESIEPAPYQGSIKPDAFKINIAKIYENDLFGTYKKELPQTDRTQFDIPFPKPPIPEQPKPPEPPKPQFLDPLQITLKGIIVVSDDESKNRAIIADNKTKREAVYKVEDTIEDAQLIKIFNTKIIFLRSNGQQEVLYLRENDAKQDPTYTLLTGWEDVIKKVDTNEFLVNPQTFATRVDNLAQFIDLLDLTTVYQKGSSIGCRIGTLEPKSLGLALGLQSGDIVTTINKIPATDTPNRFEIYKQIIGLNAEDMVTLELIRRNRPLTITYTLEEFKKTGDQPETPAQQKKRKEHIKEQQINTLKQKHKFAPTMDEIRMRERRHMLHKGKPSAQRITSSIAE